MLKVPCPQVRLLQSQKTQDVPRRKYYMNSSLKVIFIFRVETNLFFICCICSALMDTALSKMVLRAANVLFPIAPAVMEALTPALVAATVLWRSKANVYNARPSVKFAILKRPLPAYS